MKSINAITRGFSARLALVTTALLLTGCPPDDDPIVGNLGNIMVNDFGATDVGTTDVGDDMRTPPRDVGDRDISRPDAGSGDMGRVDMGRTAPTPEAEPSDPTAEATASVADPVTATSISVTARNLDDEPRMLRVGVTTSTASGVMSTEDAAVLVQPGERANTSFDLRTIGVVASAARFPARVIPRIIVEDSTGAFIERVYGDAIEVGPSLSDGFAGMLSDFNLQAVDVPDDGFGNFDTVLAAGDESDDGLAADQLKGPGEDQGPGLPNPSYADGVPDANGNYQYNFCLRTPVNWVDAGFGEDYGVQPEGTWRARGSRAHVIADGNVVFDDWLDADGCTGEFDSPSKTNIVVVGYSVATVNGNTIVVRDDAGDIDSYVRGVPYAGGSGTKHYTFPQTDRSNLLAAATFTIARWPQITGETFELNDRCDPAGNQCCDCANSTGIWIDRRTRKFLISHEVGHRLLSVYTDGYTNDCTLVLTPSTLPCAQANSNSHALTSMEWSSCAAMEGWAHFVGVRAYNDHVEGNNPGATFQYWGSSGTTVDVEAGPIGGVDTFYEDRCGGTSANAGGRGVELDWMRHWWDYHTNPSPEGPVNQQTLLDEIAADSDWMRDTVYQTISDGIESFSGADQRARWEAIADGNGVDH